MPIIDNFVIDGGHFESLSNHWKKKMETVFLLIYGLYISINHSFKINMNMTQKTTLTYTMTPARIIVISLVLDQVVMMIMMVVVMVLVVLVGMVV